jgi:hypothetical protein
VFIKVVAWAASFTARSALLVSNPVSPLIIGTKKLSVKPSWEGDAVRQAGQKWYYSTYITTEILVLANKISRIRCHTPWDFCSVSLGRGMASSWQSGTLHSKWEVHHV